MAQADEDSDPEEDEVDEVETKVKHFKTVDFDWGVAGDSFEIDKENRNHITKRKSNDKDNDNDVWETIYSFQTFNSEEYKLHYIQFKFEINQTTNKRIMIGITNQTKHANDKFFAKNDENANNKNSKNNKSKSKQNAPNFDLFYAVYGNNGEIYSDSINNYSNNQYYNGKHWNNKAIFETDDLITFEINFSQQT